MLFMSQDIGGPIECPFGFLGFSRGIIDRAALFKKVLLGFYLGYPNRL